jgi:hypothetical protein
MLQLFIGDREPYRQVKPRFTLMGNSSSKSNVNILCIPLLQTPAPTVLRPSPHHQRKQTQYKHFWGLPKIYLLALGVVWFSLAGR